MACQKWGALFQNCMHFTLTAQRRYVSMLAGFPKSGFRVAEASTLETFSTAETVAGIVGVVVIEN